MEIHESIYLMIMLLAHVLRGAGARRVAVVAAPRAGRPGDAAADAPRLRTAGLFAGRLWHLRGAAGGVPPLAREAVRDVRGLHGRRLRHMCQL